MGLRGSAAGFWSCFALIGACTGAILFDCSGSLVYTKRTGVTPDVAMLTLMYNHSTPGITEECFTRCTNMSNGCTDFIVDYDTSACFRADTSSPDYNLTFQADTFLQTYLEVMSSRNINYFQQTCLKVPATCSGKLWVVELVEGYELIGYASSVMNVTGYEECAELCLNAATALPCLSASFYVDVDGSGVCALSREDRRTKPDAFRPSGEDVIYIENQCSLPKGNSCSYEEYASSALISYTDAYVTNVTRSQCEGRCTNEKLFQCRGVTFIPASLESKETSGCSLHGDDSFSLGPGAIITQPGSVYLERVPCLDLLVTCNKTLLNVTLISGEPFNGRIFVNGYSDTCSSDGRGLNVTTLLLPLAAGNASQKCGVKVARSIGDTVRVLASALVVIQFNMILQRRGDRALKVGCAMDEGPPRNVSLGAGIMFPGDVDLELGLGSVIVNSSSSLPTVRIRLVDPTSGLINTNLTHLGDLLQLRIDLLQPNGTYNIMATHLVATTGDNSQSYLLVDGRGCPPDPATFPGFRRDPSSGSLFADFRAFKFPGSTVVRFSVMVQFCPGACQAVFCTNGVPVTTHRRKRTLADSSSVTGESPSQPRRELLLELADSASVGVATTPSLQSRELPLVLADSSPVSGESPSPLRSERSLELADSSSVGVALSRSLPRRVLPLELADSPPVGVATTSWLPRRELPLELAFTVLGPKNPGDPRLLSQTVASNETILLATINYDALVCVSYASFLGIILGWMAIQVVLLIACFFLVRWWMKREEKVLEHKLDEDFNTFEHRRVHWADRDPHSSY